MLKLAGKLTIQRAAELASSIGQLIAEEEHAAVLDLAAVTSADISFLQILCSARRTARGDGKSLSIVSPSDALLRTVKTAGFERRQPCSHCEGEACLWQSKEGL
jgi:anti-anti-sigma factor